MMLVLTVATGLMAGIYFAFSVVVIKALAQLPNTEGAKAMNQINDVILKTTFMPLFFISSLWYLGLLFWNTFNPASSDPSVIWASLIYLIGMFGVTAFGNVPLNNELKRNADDSKALAASWSRYIRTWVRLNHIRTLSCIAAIVLLNYGMLPIH